jgi:hypothetical protein
MDEEQSRLNVMSIGLSVDRDSNFHGVPPGKKPLASTAPRERLRILAVVCAGKTLLY